MDEVSCSGKRVLITGADGFVGRWLTKFLIERGADVMGLGLHPPKERTPWDSCRYEVCDVTDREGLFCLVDDFRPHWVFHLAAQSSVKRSWEEPDLTFRVALFGQEYLFRALLESGLDPVVLVACSAEEYGVVDEGELPLAEEQPLRPTSPYALSKVIQDYHAQFAYRSLGLRTIRARAFNVTGPGQPSHFVVADFARQIAEVESGLRKPLMEVGNLDARRDFCDVRDLVRAYLLLADRGRPGEAYNICSGVDRTIKSVLDELVAMSEVPIQVEVDPAKFRKVDVPVLRGDPRKIERETGWRAAIPFEKTLKDTLEWWRKKIRLSMGREEGDISG